MYVSEQSNRRKLWRQRYPAIISGLLSMFQMILTLVIVGCQVGGDLVQFPQMNIFVGYWTFPFFMFAWISLSSASCCCRTRCCGIATLVFQCLSIPMSLCVIGFDAYFLNNPTQCFFSNNCGTYTYSGYNSNSYRYNNTYNNYYLSNTDNLYSIKVPLTKGQLAAGVLMFVSCIIYIIIYAITNHQVRKHSQYGNGPSVPVVVMPTSTQYVPSVVMPISTQYVPPVVSPTSIQYVPPVVIPTPVPVNRSVPPPSNRPVESDTNLTPVRIPLICPNCRSRFQVSTQDN